MIKPWEKYAGAPPMADGPWSKYTPEAPEDDVGATEPVAPARDVSKFESVMRGAGQGLTLGFQDELAGLISSLFSDRTYEEARDTSRRLNKEAREANPKTFMAADIGGAVLPAVVATVASGGTAAPAAGGSFMRALAPSTVKGLAAIGATEAVGRSEDESIEDLAIDAATGGLLGGGLGLASKAVGAGARGLRAGRLAETAQRQGARAMGNTKRFLSDPKKLARAKADAQILLDAATPEGKPVMGWFDSAEEIAQNVDALKKQTGEAIGTYLESVNMRGKFFDPTTAVRDLNRMRPVSPTTGKVLRGGAYDDIHRSIDNAIQTVKAHGKKPMSFEEANEIKGVLQDLANWNSNKQATVLDKKIAGTFRGSVDDALEAVSNTPRNTAAFEGFKADKAAYGAASRGQDSIMNRVSSEMGNNAVGLGDLVLAAPTLATHGPGAAGAVFGAKRAVDRFGAQVTAKTFNRAAKISAATLEPMIKAHPELFGKYLPALQNAMARGGENLAVTHYVLGQSDPEYQAIIEGIGQ